MNDWCCRGGMQVHRAPEELGGQVELNHRFAIGRGSDCGLKLGWDGVSKRHAFLEAFFLPPPPGDDRVASEPSMAVGAPHSAPLNEITDS